jgi:2-C-methyl-D-erythritol 2,4-cyclodiphosphate synthase
MNNIRIGHGFDVHRLVAKRALIIGGEKIPYKKGLLGHSDADVLLHAIGDALLGALSLGDLGQHFPDTDPAYKSADSKGLLSKIYRLILKAGFCIGNVDCIIMAQAPKMASHVPAMRKTIARLLETRADRISVKATTTEKLGFIGRGEGIAASAIILLHRKRK